MKGPLDTSLAYKYFMSYRLMDGQRYDETVVPYKPHRSFRKLIKEFMNKQKQLQLLFSILVAGITALMLNSALAPLGGTLLLLLFLTAVALPFVPLVHSWTTPTHIGVSPKGIRFYSLHWYGDKVSKPIPWHKIDMVSLAWQKSNIGQNEWVEVIGKGLDAERLMRFSLDGIALGDNRKRLLAALKQNLSSKQVDIPLQDALNPVKLGSHTMLWLDVLSGSSKRLIEDHLSEGHVICNERYRIVEQLGIGGQAVAYVAEQVDAKSTTQNTVVLKEFVLPVEASLKISKRAFEAIEQESKLLAQVSHPRIVALLDLFVDDQRAYMVLEHVRGKNMRQEVQDKGAIGQTDLIELALQMCDVLKHLHSLDPPVIHRDFTPDNLILDPVKGIKLIDFNVAQQYEASATRTVVGKHSFIPPEQFRGKACPQSDLYALGATLFYLLTGEEPEPITVAHPRNLVPMISRQLDDVVAKCTAQDLESRYKDSDEIARDLLLIKETMLTYSHISSIIAEFEQVGATKIVNALKDVYLDSKDSSEEKVFLAVRDILNDCIDSGEAERLKMGFTVSNLTKEVEDILRTRGNLIDISQ